MFSLTYLSLFPPPNSDIKAANVLTTKEGTVKLADFGVATIAKAQRKSMDTQNPSSAQEVLGSPYWMAPEIIQMEGAQPSSDIWSLGCVVLELMTGKPPYFDMPQMSAMFKIAESEDPPPFPESISADLTAFLLLCFERDPAKRPSATELLEHKWIVSARERKGKGSSKIGKRGDSTSSTGTSGDTSGDDSDVKIETPRKRKANRKDSYALSGSGEVPGSSGTPRNSIRSTTFSSLR
jgi:serine/threonine protein kinase